VENLLGDIQTDCGNFRHGRLPEVVFNTSTLAHRCRRGASTPSHPVIRRGYGTPHHLPFIQLTSAPSPLTFVTSTA
jgi:hypothetical protein